MCSSCIREKILTYKFTNSQEWDPCLGWGEGASIYISDWRTPKESNSYGCFCHYKPGKNFATPHYHSNVKCILVISRIWIPKVSPRQMNGPVTKKKNKKIKYYLSKDSIIVIHEFHKKKGEKKKVKTLRMDFYDRGLFPQWWFQVVWTDCVICLLRRKNILAFLSNAKIHILLTIKILRKM